MCTGSVRNRLLMHLRFNNPLYANIEINQSNIPFDLIDIDHEIAINCNSKYLSDNSFQDKQKDLILIERLIFQNPFHVHRTAVDKTNLIDTAFSENEFTTIADLLL